MFFHIPISFPIHSFLTSRKNNGIIKENKMKYVLTPEEVSEFTGQTPAVIIATFRYAPEVAHFWAGSDLRIISYDFLSFMEKYADVKTISRLGQYIENSRTA